MHRFIYLDTEISEEAKSEIEIERRSNIAKEKFSKIAHLLTSKKLKLTTKLRIIKCYVYSIFTYGCESWTLSKVLQTKIYAMEMWCLRRIGNIKWSDRVTNEAVLQIMNTKRQLLKSIQKRKTEYFSHNKTYSKDTHLQSGMNDGGQHSSSCSYSTKTTSSKSYLKRIFRVEKAFTHHEILKCDPSLLWNSTLLKLIILNNFDVRLFWVHWPIFFSKKIIFLVKQHLVVSFCTSELIDRILLKKRVYGSSEDILF